MYDRLDELGIDFSVLYPTKGFGIAGIEDPEIRQGVCRGFNDYYADTYAQYADRMAPAGVIPMHTPDEAVAELEHCKAIGLKVVGFPEGVTRPIPNPDPGNVTPFMYPGQAWWFDHFGIDSAYDYDPVWAKAEELGFAITCHGGLGNMPTGSFVSRTNYSYNHIGSFAQRMHHMCKSLFMGGITTRFPRLNIAFLECGVGWAAILLADLLEHWEKRNPEALPSLDPAAIDWALARAADPHPRRRGPAGRSRRHRPRRRHAGASRHGRAARRAATTGASSTCPPSASWSTASCPGSSSGARPTTARSPTPSRKANPFGARLQPVFSSDLAHWDVEDMSEVVAEAFGLVRKGVLEEQDFREFVFENPARLLLGQNPDIFVGTAVEAATRPLADGRPRRAVGGRRLMAAAGATVTVLRGGTVVDGTGGAGRRGRRRAGRRAHRRGRPRPRRARRAPRSSTARGWSSRPGFIDPHTHYDAQVLWDPELTPSSWHGVTTVVVGNCGFGIAPTRPEHRPTILRVLENVEGMPLDALEAGIPWTFETFPEYLDAVERQTARHQRGRAARPHAAAVLRAGRRRHRAGRHHRRGRPHGGTSSPRHSTPGPWASPPRAPSRTSVPTASRCPAGCATSTRSAPWRGCSAASTRARSSRRGGPTCSSRSSPTSPGRSTVRCRGRRS